MLPELSAELADSAKLIRRVRGQELCRNSRLTPDQSSSYEPALKLICSEPARGGTRAGSHPLRNYFKLQADIHGTGKIREAHLHQSWEIFRTDSENNCPANRHTEWILRC